MQREVLRDLKLLYEKKSDYSNIKLYDTQDGKLMLTLNTYVQFLEGEDEHIYHDSLIKSICNTSYNNMFYLILGGGDGLAARNIFKLDPKANITIVDIDKEVVELCKTNERITKINEDSLLKCFISNNDALQWVPNCKEQYDMIVCDFPDGNNEELKKLYTKEFLTQIVKLLNTNGIINIQTHLSIADNVLKIIKELLGNGEVIEYKMPFLGEGKIINGKNYT